MKANELRIGNLINTPYEKEAKMKSIVEDDSWGGYYIVTNNNKTSITVVKPIPLTEECLLKFGFEARKDVFFKFGGYAHMISLNKNFDTYRVEIVNQSISRIKYVHQLQNLYFALTGEELNFEL